MPADLLLSRPESLRVLVVAAHPDDETVGAGVLLGRLRDVKILCVTDGAPKRASLRPAAHAGSRERYADARRQELLSAAAIAGIPPARVTMLGVVDQESVFSLVHVARRIARAAASADVLVTHPYEGGHPDHDACAYASHTACDLLRRERRSAPVLIEMTSYHAEGDAFVVGRFLPAARTESVLEPTPEEAARKERMLAAHASQSAMLANFPVGPERFRVAPRYDFAAPPHEGALWYERLGWPLDGVRWRLLAGQAAFALGARPSNDAVRAPGACEARSRRAEEG